MDGCLGNFYIYGWDPESAHITYVDNDTLYVLAIAQAATPVPLFTHPNLNGLYARWSPDGQWIAVVTTIWEYADDTADGLNTYWLISTAGDSPQELASRPTFAMEHVAHEITWSVDSQYLLLLGLNQVLDLSGEQVSAPLPGAAFWLPGAAQLLVNGLEGLRLMTVTGAEIATISSQYAPAWAFSHDGRQLAYSQPDDAGQINLFIYTLSEQETHFIGAVPAGVFPLRWSRHDDYLILGGAQGNQSVIWAIEALPDSTAELILEDALLIEVIGN